MTGACVSYLVEELEMMVILRINRKFLEHMREHYNEHSKQHFGRTVIEPDPEDETGARETT